MTRNHDRRVRYWQAFKFCYWCGRETILGESVDGQKQAHNLAVLDRVFPKDSLINRKLQEKALEMPVVLSCFKCRKSEDNRNPPPSPRQTHKFLQAYVNEHPDIALKIPELEMVLAELAQKAKNQEKDELKQAEWHRYRSCTRKMRYSTIEKVEDARKALINHRNYDGEPIAIYHCGFCDGFHLGHTIKSEQARENFTRR